MIENTVLFKRKCTPESKCNVVLCLKKSQAANFKGMSVLRCVSTGPSCSFCSSLSGLWGGSRELWPPLPQLLGSPSSRVESALLSNIHDPFPWQVSKVSDLLLHLKILCLAFCLFIHSFICLFACFWWPSASNLKPCLMLYDYSNLKFMPRSRFVSFHLGCWLVCCFCLWIFWNMSQVSLDWSKTHYVPKDDFDLFSFCLYLPSARSAWISHYSQLQPLLVLFWRLSSLCGSGWSWYKCPWLVSSLWSCCLHQPGTGINTAHHYAMIFWF